MRVIVNADDFGYSRDTVSATIDLFEQRVLTSASIMPRMPETAAAVKFARQHCAGSFGVHLTFLTDTIERPLTDSCHLSTLTTADGSFLDTNAVRRRALLGQLSENEIIREMTAQIGSLVDAGVALSHVDSHGHLHTLPAFRRALTEVLPKFGIKRVRNVQNLYFARQLTKPSFWLGTCFARKIKRSFITTDRFFMAAGSFIDPQWPEQLVRRLHLHVRGSLEVGVHPGYREEWRKQEFDYAKRLVRALTAAGNEMISWSNLI